jgi:hypothetical protein
MQARARAKTEATEAHECGEHWDAVNTSFSSCAATPDGNILLAPRSHPAVVLLAYDAGEDCTAAHANAKLCIVD